MTIEAALIFPFMIFIICAMLWLSFYMYDTVAFTCDCDRYLCALEREGGRDEETTAVEEADYIGGYFLVGCSTREVESSGRTLTFKGDLSMDFTDSAVPQFLRPTFGEYSLQRTRLMDNRVSYARLISVGKKVYTEVKNIWEAEGENGS